MNRLVLIGNGFDLAHNFMEFAKQEIDTNFKMAPIYNPDLYKNDFFI